MKSTRVIPVTRHMPEWDRIEASVQVLNSGGIVAFPTDTVYGLAASIYSAEAIERLSQLKERRLGHGFVVLIADPSWLNELVRALEPRLKQLVKDYWPGPLTIVFKASDRVPQGVRAADGTIALRMPNDTLTQSILRACGVPLAVPSANPRGAQPALSADEVIAYFDGKVDLVLDGGRVATSGVSTIIAARGKRLMVLREGCLSLLQGVK